MTIRRATSVDVFPTVATQAKAPVESSLSANASERLPALLLEAVPGPGSKSTVPVNCPLTYTPPAASVVTPNARASGATIALAHTSAPPGDCLRT
jgi:hypothetical protein